VEECEYYRYPIGTAFEKEDCSHCICKLGGIEHCTKKECPKCNKVSTLVFRDKNLLYI